MVVTIGVLGGDAVLHSLLDRHKARFQPCKLKSLAEAGAALSWLRSADAEADVLVIGPGVESAVRIAERAVGMGRGAEILICAHPDRHAVIKAELDRSYFIGNAAPCLSTEEPDAIARALEDALARSRKRRRYEGLVSATEGQIAHAASVLASPRARNVEALWKYAPIGVLVTDAPEGRVLDRNQKSAELLGVDEGAKLGACFAASDGVRLEALLAAKPNATPTPHVFVVNRGGEEGAHVEILIAAGDDDATRLLLVQDVTERHLAEEELLRRLALIESQSQQIEQLSTPIIQVWEGVLCLPVVGSVDARRAERMMGALLTEVVSARAASVIVDLTGVPAVDAATADGLMGMVRASKLLGATCFLSGISARVAHAVVELGLDLRGINTFPSLYAALRYVLKNKRASAPAN